MYWLFTKKVQRHVTIQADEVVYQACYGLGATVVQVANRTLSVGRETWSVPQKDEGLASSLSRGGVIAISNKRLLFFAKRFAIGKPGKLTADWPLSQLTNISWIDPQLSISFVDHSKASLHVPRNQSPLKLVSAWQALDPTLSEIETNPNSF